MVRFSKRETKDAINMLGKLFLIHVGVTIFIFGCYMACGFIAAFLYR